MSRVYSWRAMGTDYRLWLPTLNESDGEAVAFELREAVKRLERQLSLYQPDSDLCYLNAHAHQHPVCLEPEMFRLIQLCKALWEQTEGAFDPSITPVLRLWGFVDKQYRVPEPSAIEQAMEQVGMDLVLLEPEGRWVYYAVPGVELSFGAIGKGWAVAECRRLLNELGIPSALIDAGGSTFYALGHSPDDSGWRVRATPECEIVLTDRAFATSGGAEQWFEAGGKRYCHLIDPRTGYPLPSWRQLSLVHSDPVLADALSTALVVDPELRTRFPDLQMWLEDASE
ncbi:MAG: FAD:protein FMN transferase [Fimbriimonadales bacterium]